MANRIITAITGLSIATATLFFTPYQNDGYIFSKCKLELTYTSYYQKLVGGPFSVESSRIANILNRTSEGNLALHGVGLIIADGMALTARHVAEPLNNPVVRIQSKDYDGEVRDIVHKTPGIDLAVVAYKPQGKQYEPLRIKKADIGDRITVVTFDPQPSLSPLEISVHVENTGINTLSHELMLKARQNGHTSVRPGMSGSSGLADDGRLAAILVEAQNPFAYLVNATEIADYLERICNK